MYAGGRDTFGSGWHQMHVLDQLLGQLTRPSLVDATLPSSVRDQLRAIGVAVDSSRRREEIIAELWGRKRPLMRELYAYDDSTPPCA
jgi:hypothetical protein